MSKQQRIVHARSVVASGLAPRQRAVSGLWKAEPLQRISRYSHSEHACLSPSGESGSLKTPEARLRGSDLTSILKTTKKPGTSEFNISLSLSVNEGRFKSLLVKLAERSHHPHYRHAALIAKGKRIFGYGLNGTSRHAEISALKTTLPLKNSTLYTLMLRRDGSIGKGIPCNACIKAIRSAGIRKIVVYL